MRAVNLLPRDLEQSRKAPATPILAGCAGLVVVASILAAGYLSASSKVGKQNEQVAALQAELAAVPRPDTTPTAVSALPAERAARASALSSALAQRVAWDRLLREVSLVLPEDVWLTNLTARTPIQAAGVAAPAPTTVDDTGFTLQGFTYSQAGVARLLSRLEVIPDLQGVALKSSTKTEVGNRPIFQFSIGGAVRTPGAAS